MRDPNDITLEQFKRWMQDQGIGFMMLQRDNPPLNHYVNFATAIDRDLFYQAFDELTKGCSGPFAGWVGQVSALPDPDHVPTQPVFFQRRCCTYCHKMFHDHVDGQCLFASTKFSLEKPQ